MLARPLGGPEGPPCGWLWPWHCPGSGSGTPAPPPGAGDSWAIPGGSCGIRAGCPPSAGLCPGPRAATRSPWDALSCLLPSVSSSLHCSCRHDWRTVHAPVCSTNILLNSYCVSGTVVDAEANHRQNPASPELTQGGGGFPWRHEMSFLCLGLPFPHLGNPSSWANPSSPFRSASSAPNSPGTV